MSRSRPLRVLILEDRPDDAELMITQLRRDGFDPTWQRVETEPEFLAGLDGEQDVILADYRLPRFDASRALELVRERGLRIPFIIVSGSIGEELAVAAIRQGADDYLLKDRLARLGKAVEHVLERRRLEEDRESGEERLRASLREKETLLREIHHRVKNNLQVVCSLLNLQRHRLEDKESVDALAASIDRVRSMALVHERLYRADDLARIDFLEYLRELAVALCGSYDIDMGRVDVASECEDLRLALDEAIPCGLIVNELVTNSLKHAFSGERSGRVRIEVAPGIEGRVMLSVRDDGVGFPEDFEPVRDRSLGLLMVQQLVRQLAGDIEFGNVDGACVRVTFDPDRSG